MHVFYALSTVSGVGGIAEKKNRTNPAFIQFIMLWATTHEDRRQTSNYCILEGFVVLEHWLDMVTLFGK